MPPYEVRFLPDRRGGVVPRSAGEVSWERGHMEALAESRRYVGMEQRGGKCPDFADCAGWTETMQEFADVQSR